jgi:uncharacterized protein (TIGR02147 family)
VSGEQRGQRSKLAQALKVQTAFISRVLHGDAHFSLEHAIPISQFLEHSEGEADFFLLLLQKDRAGSAALKSYFERQLEKIHEQRKLIAERIQVKSSLSPEDQTTYYSSWHYAAIHVMLLVPRWQRPEAIAKHLQLTVAHVRQTLDFLLSIGLAKEAEGRYLSGARRIHLGKGSPILLRHHNNWRLRAMQSMDQPNAENVFYSGPLCLSEGDARKLHGMILKFLEEIEALVKPSPEEKVICLNLDYFEV